MRPRARFLYGTVRMLLDGPLELHPSARRGIDATVTDVIISTMRGLELTQPTRGIGEVRAVAATA